jgi:hypothetical protein
MSAPRSEMVTIRLSPDEHARAERVAEYHGLNVAALFRMLVKREARDIGEQGEEFTPPAIAATKPARRK